MNATKNDYYMTTLPRTIVTKLGLAYYAVEAFKLTVYVLSYNNTLV